MRDYVETVESKATLATEAICVVIAEADRWQTIDIAHSALLNVRKMRDQMRDETTKRLNRPAERGDGA